MRINIPLFIGAFVPWTLLAVAVCTHRAGTPVWIADLVHDVLPDSVLTRWSPSFPILAFTDGLLLAFALVEPLVQEHVHKIRMTDVPAPATRPLESADDPDAVTARSPQPVD